MLQRLASTKPSKTEPTQGFNIKTVEEKGFKLNMWDIGGQRAIRPYWRNYYDGTQVLIWVVDANDDDRFAEARSELDALMKEKQLDRVPMLVLANKSDLVGAANADTVAERMGLAGIKGRKMECKSVSGKTGDGLRDAFDWAVGIMARKG